MSQIFVARSLIQRVRLAPRLSVASVRLVNTIGSKPLGEAAAASVSVGSITLFAACYYMSKQANRFALLGIVHVAGQCSIIQPTP
jgi:predicted anti-sigma-YlaC factor YlaD